MQSSCWLRRCKVHRFIGIFIRIRHQPTRIIHIPSKACETWSQLVTWRIGKPARGCSGGARRARLRQSKSCQFNLWTRWAATRVHFQRLGMANDDPYRFFTTPSGLRMFGTTQWSNWLTQVLVMNGMFCISISCIVSNNWQEIGHHWCVFEH